MNAQAVGLILGAIAVMVLLVHIVTHDYHIQPGQLYPDGQRERRPDHSPDPLVPPHDLAGYTFVSFSVPAAKGWHREHRATVVDLKTRKATR